ncbi:hypothetical protein [Fodinicola acaciae]|uniref:hypothetical protein n=1 Tax=Fodinicola acaciae TaxID=2681555 RepID=UPI0013D8ADE1|nr:hypothetical protein [Fodinicola acaciae]
MKRHPAVTVAVVACVLAGVATLAADGSVVFQLLTSDNTQAEPVGGVGGLVVRAAWALVRAIGLILAARHVNRGSAAARGVVIVLAVSTVFNTVRLVGGRYDPAVGPLPHALVDGLLIASAALCAALILLVVWLAPVREHLSRPPTKRRNLLIRLVTPSPDEPTWVLTARPLAASLAACTVVPLLVGAAGLFTGDLASRYPALRVVAATAALSAQLVVVLILVLVLPYALVGLGKVPGARWVVSLLAVMVIASQPVICPMVLGVDGLVRDALPAATAALVVIYGLIFNRNARRWFRRSRTSSGSRLAA